MTSEGTDLIDRMAWAVERLKDIPMGPPVFYVSDTAQRILMINHQVRQRVNVKRWRGPRLRTLVRRPSEAKRRVNWINGASVAFAGGITSPTRAWARVSYI
jgi:hypothetical protein